MSRPVCRCLPTSVCTCDSCTDCYEMLTKLEVEQGWDEYLHDCRVLASGKVKRSVSLYLKCNECRLADAGFIVMPDGTVQAKP